MFRQVIPGNSFGITVVGPDKVAQMGSCAGSPRMEWRRSETTAMSIPVIS